MKLGVLKESLTEETRVSITPDIVKKFVSEGYTCLVESQAGASSQFSDDDYRESGAEVKDHNSVISESDVLFQINPFNEDDFNQLKKGQVLISQMYHLSNPEYVKKLSEKGVTAFSLDAMPRITRAQDMDVLSSQNNLAGYKAVIVGANEITRIFPLMMTAAGTITPSKVLIFGVGVAGLQAIATAKRLGAVVEATDIRPETKEQTESLGGKFIYVEPDEGEVSEGGYAKEASEDYKRRQKEAVEASLFKADLVITTAMIPGRKAPVLISAEQVAKMKKGAVIIDLAGNTGGNCELSEPNATVVKHGVKIVGTTMAPYSVATNASDLFAKNIYNFVKLLATSKEGFKWDLEDEITDATLIIKEGEIRK
ncbi:MAG: Re/Si-specific NAD(P)(+) transhydrogenase subunit alpha [Tenacibaculum sp.]|nr:Re/Si-specific NAD(P)(+) transhydrogenase subunit alpha [Tenacibaculum sp.]